MSEYDPLQEENKRILESYRVQAARSREVFKAFVLQGWSEAQAFELTKVWLRRPADFTPADMMAITDKMLGRMHGEIE